MSLTFKALRAANVARRPQFRNKKGKVVDPSDWTVADFLMALTGELGELANLFTHIRRGDFDENDEGVIDEVGKELADIQIYLDLLAHRCDIDLADFVVRKFNEVSDRVGSTVRLHHEAV